jgi:hypothetical protein
MLAVALRLSSPLKGHSKPSEISVGGSTKTAPALVASAHHAVPAAIVVAASNKPLPMDCHIVLVNMKAPA